MMVMSEECYHGHKSFMLQKRDRHAHARLHDGSTSTYAIGVAIKSSLSCETPCERHSVVKHYVRGTQYRLIKLLPQVVKHHVRGAQ